MQEDKEMAKFAGPLASSCTKLFIYTVFF